jgi:hypothetical protein
MLTKHVIETYKAQSLKYGEKFRYDVVVRERRYEESKARGSKKSPKLA